MELQGRAEAFFKEDGESNIWGIIRQIHAGVDGKVKTKHNEAGVSQRSGKAP